MKVIIDTDKNKLHIEDKKGSTTMSLYSNEAFELISHYWLKTGWNQKYVYTFSWLGRPVIQLPEDMIRVQEVIYRVKPDIIIETGVAHGGSLIYYATVLKAMGQGKVVGIDIEIRPHNRKAIESHELFPLITLIEGDSVSPEVIDKVKSLVRAGETVMVILDSNHTKQHVLNELEAYAPLVSTGSYIVATDGFMKYLHDVPRGHIHWTRDNPINAVLEFAANHPEFIIEQPAWPFNESELTKNITHWPGAYLRRR